MTQTLSHPASDDAAAPMPPDGAQPAATASSPGRIASTLARLRHFLATRQPRLVPTIVTCAMMPMLLGLGSWQIARLHEKNALLRHMEAALAQPPADSRLAWPQDDTAWQELDYRPVTVQGQWLDLRRFKLSPRTYDGQAGYQLIVPLRLKDNQIVLVNRGFVPTDQEIMPRQAGSDDRVAVTGVARIPEAQKPDGMPENIPGRNQWVWTDLAAMAPRTGFGRVAPVILYEARDPERDTYPIGGQLPLPQHNRHWHYAVTWYALALILMGVYIMSMGPKPEKSGTLDEQGPNGAAVAAKDDLADPVARRGRYPEATD